MNSHKNDKRLQESTFITLMNNKNDRKQFMFYFHILLLILLSLFAVSFITNIEQTLTISGQIVPLDQIAKIKHETGGEVRKIYVDDYQYVKAGQPLVTLDNNKIITSINQNESKLRVVNTEIINAVAYLKKNINSIRETVIFSEVEQFLNKLSDNIINSREFSDASRLISLYKDDVIQEQIHQNEIDVKRLESDLKSLGNKLKYVGEQRKIYNKLLESKNVSKIQALDYEVKYIDLVRDIEKTSSELDMKIRETNELKSKRIVSEQDGIREKYEQLVKLNKEKIDLESNLTQFKNLLDNLTLKSPISGIVQGLKVVQGVTIQPGEEVVSIIPGSSKLVFEAKANLTQKGKINFKDTAEVQFDGFNILEFNRVKAKIIKISPYTFSEEYSNDRFFKILLELDSMVVESKHNSFQIKPGMSGVAYINSGNRSLFSYMFGPIYNSFYNAYNEK